MQQHARRVKDMGGVGGIAAKHKPAPVTSDERRNSSFQRGRNMWAVFVVMLVALVACVESGIHGRTAFYSCFTLCLSIFCELE